MNLEENIIKLSTLVDDYSINYLHKQSKFIDPRIFVIDFKGIVKRAKDAIKGKGFSKEIEDYIKKLQDQNRKFEFFTYQDYYLRQTLNLLKDIKHKVEEQKISHIYLTHSFSSNELMVSIYGDKGKSKYDDQLYCYSSEFDFSSVWGFLDSPEFDEFAESLELVDVEDEEYPQIYDKLYKFRSYKLVKKALNNSNCQKLLNEIKKGENISVAIGEHDNWTFTIYGSAT